MYNTVELVSIVDNIYHSTVISQCWIVVENQDQKDLLKSVLLRKHYPLEYTISICLFDVFHNTFYESNYKNQPDSQTTVIIPKHLAFRYGLSICNLSAPNCIIFVV
jgi:hypothetical protein